MCVCVCVCMSSAHCVYRLQGLTDYQEQKACDRLQDDKISMHLFAKMMTAGSDPAGAGDKTMMVEQTFV